MAISVYDSTRTHEREIFIHRAASATVGGSVMLGGAAGTQAEK